jgi:hypothetical protein
MQLLHALPAIGALLAGARSTGAPWACEATTYSSTEVATPGTLLVGDAASMIDPLSSFGVKKALASAWLAAVVVHTARVAPEHLDLALAYFRERESAYVQSASRVLGALSRDVVGFAPIRDAATAVSATGDVATRDAAADGATLPFWIARAEGGGDGDQMGAGDGPNVEALRYDPEVLAAFALLRDQPTIRISAAEGARAVMRPVVRGNVVVPEEHLLLRGFAGGVRYLRNVDLVALRQVAQRHDDVGRMYADYARSMGAIPLPDFLGALSVLIAKDGARLLDIRPVHP